MAKKKKESKSNITENWLPVKGITNNTIVCSKGKKEVFVTGVKVFPKNIFILDQASQDMVLNQLKNLYNGIDFEFWLIVADRPVDISVFLADLQLQFNKEQNPVIKKMIRQDMEKAELFVRNDVVDTEYYILFREANPDVISKRIRALINGLASCGLNATQTTNDDLRLILDNFLNGGEKTEYRVVMPS